MTIPGPAAFDVALARGAKAPWCPPPRLTKNIVTASRPATAAAAAIHRRAFGGSWKCRSGPWLISSSTRNRSRSLANSAKHRVRTRAIRAFRHAFAEVAACDRRDERVDRVLVGRERPGGGVR